MLTKQSAQELGRRMRKQMRDPKQWGIYVHYNLGWFVRLTHKPSGGLLSVLPDYSGEPIYHAMLSLTSPLSGDVRWRDYKVFKKPQAAVDYIMSRAWHQISSELQIFKAIAGEPGGALQLRRKGKG